MMRVALLVAVAAAAPCNFRLDFDGVRHEAVFDDGADDDELAAIVRNVLDRVVDHYDEGALLKFYGSVAADCDDEYGYTCVGDWLDAAMLPTGSIDREQARFRFRFVTGTFTGHGAMHCHYLNHEDLGCLTYFKIEEHGGY